MDSLQASYRSFSFVIPVLDTGIHHEDQRAITPYGFPAFAGNDEKVGNDKRLSPRDETMPQGTLTP